MALKNVSQFIKIRLKKPLIILALLGALLLIMVSALIYCKNLVKLPNSKEATKVSFVIENGHGLETISRNLEGSGLIRSAFVFILYLNFNGWADNVMAGEYKIPKNLSMVEVAQMITSGKIASQRVTFPEGWTIERMADRLEEKNIVTRAEFLAATKKDYKSDNFLFLQSKPPGLNLEGYLYPDTYDFSENITAEEIVGIMLSNFGRKFDEKAQARVKESGLTIHEIVTLASIVEREVSSPNDRKLVASVFLNRLEIGMPLESCATLQFITGLNKPIFSYEETRIDHPYNTYIIRGLPPGPIGNPSIDSIMAVIDPKESEYLFFLSSADGRTHFSKNFQEHNIKKSRYLN